MLVLLGVLREIAQTSVEPSCDGSREHYSWIASKSLLDRVDKRVPFELYLCLVVVFESSIGRLDNSKVKDNHG